MTATDSFDADRLDAWLEGNPFPSASLNGHSDSHADLVGTAQRFHAEIGAAERGLPVPARAIWEDVMQRTADLTISPPVIAATNGDGLTETPVPDRRPIPDLPQGRGYWFVTGSLIVVVILAISAFAYLANRPSNGGDDVTGLGVSAFTPNAGWQMMGSPAADDPSAVPFTIVDPEEIDCSEIVRRSNEQISGLQANPGEFPDREYGPAVRADAEDAGLVSITDQYVTACRSDWRTLASPRLISDVQDTGSPAALFPGYYLDRGMTIEEISALLQGLLVATDITDLDQVIAPTGELGDDANWMPVVDPNHVFVFPDGRLGAVQTTLVSAEDENLVKERGSILSQFVFYVQDPTQDGTWVLDEILPVCVGDCDWWWNSIEVVEATSATPAIGTPEMDGWPVTVEPEATPADAGFTMLPPASPHDDDGFVAPPRTPDTGSTSEPLFPHLESSPVASPTDDIHRWLVPFSAMDCTPPDPNDPNAIDGSSLPTNLVIDVDSHLPYGEAPSEQQVAIADQAQLIMSQCADMTMFTDDFTWMGVAEWVPLTAEQLAASQKISKALPDQNPANYFIVRPSIDPDFRGRSVLLPEDVMMLADGRLGAPTRMLLSLQSDADWVHSQMQDGSFAISVFYTFEQEGQEWLLDEMFPVCIGECGDFWTAAANDTNLEGTPGPMFPEQLPPIAPDFPPITADECTVSGLKADEVSAIARDPGVEPDHSYDPIGPARWEVADPAVRSDRAWLACAVFGSTGQKTALQTPWFTVTGPQRDVVGRNGTVDEAEAAVEERAELSAALLNGDPLEYVIPADQTESDIIASLGNPVAEYPYGDRAVQLADGRVAIPQMTLIASDRYETYVEIRSELPYYTVPVHIMFRDPDTHLWQVDEVTWVCGGDCDLMIADLREQEATWLDQANPQPATPVATPALSNAASDDSEWLVDPESITCDRANGNWDGTNAIGIPGTINDYVPFATAPAETQRGIARTYQLLSGRCYGELDAADYFSETLWRFPLRTDNLPVNQSELEIARAISEAINTGDALDFVHATDAPVELIQPIFSHFALLPSTVVELPDGRLGAPLQVVVETNSPDDLETWIAETGGLIVSRFVVFAPTEDGYVMEATIPICLGECDDYWSGYVVEDSTPMATVASSPVGANGTYQMVTAEECTVEGLTVDEVSAIVRDPGEAPSRSYVPVGPAAAADAEAALAADRAWQACSTFGSIGQRAELQTPWLTANGPELDALGNSIDDIISAIEQRRSLSEAMLTDYPLDYVVASGQTEVDMLADLTTPWTYVPHPTVAFILDDGRIVIPQLSVVGDDSYIFSDDYESPGPYFGTFVHILAKDPATGAWLMDEIIWLNGGDIDSLIIDLREDEATSLEQSGQAPATPEATPAAGS